MCQLTTETSFGMIFLVSHHHQPSLTTYFGHVEVPSPSSQLTMVPRPRSCQALASVEETISALSYAEQAAGIRNRPRVASVGIRWGWRSGWIRWTNSDWKSHGGLVGWWKSHPWSLGLLGVGEVAGIVFKTHNQVILLVTFLGWWIHVIRTQRLFQRDQPNDRGSRSVTAAESPARHWNSNQSINQPTNQPTNRSINWEVGNRSPKIHIFWSTRAWSPNPMTQCFLLGQGMKLEIRDPMASNPTCYQNISKPDRNTLGVQRSLDKWSFRTDPFLVVI